MNIYGLQKTTLLDFPGHLACTVFLNGCNFRCSFCQNKDLVYQSANDSIDMETFFSFLSKRKKTLEGVCITGGEPTLYGEELIDFIKDIRSFGLKIKLDTNGSRPAILKNIIEQKLVDYIAMDIKASRKKYESVCDCTVPMEDICASVNLLISRMPCYEFRTTLVKELHSLEDLLDIREWIRGANAYFLQSYQASEQCIRSDYHSFTREEFVFFQNILKETLPNTYLRGIE